MKITEDYRVKDADFNMHKITIPKYDSEKMQKVTKENPRWVHFGAGNLYRCFHAQVASELLDMGEMQEGIVVAETFGEDLIEEVYHAQKNRSLTVTMKADGSFTKELIASTAEALFFHRNKPVEVERLTNIFKAPSLQLATFTITEKGYAIKDSQGNLLEQVIHDIACGVHFAKLENTMAKIAYLLHERFLAGQLPIAMVSTDNFSHNGDRFKAAVLEIAKGWVSAGHVDAAFVNYLQAGEKVSFPYSMIDRITPLPSDAIAKTLREEGIEGMEPFLSKNQKMNLAAFVNTEEVHYLAIEEDFPNGRPALEKASGVFLGNRDTINKADLMKVCTCLNPLHTALAVFGCMLGFERIYEEVQDKDLCSLIEQIGFIEGLPVVENPGIIDPKEFINEVIYKRFANPNVPDAPQRIATDTSQKVGIRFGETLRAYVEAPDKDVTKLHFIPLTIAAWCRYLLGIDDEGNSFEVSPDPLYKELYKLLSEIKLGDTDKGKVHQALEPILSNSSIFGLDLYEIGLGKRIEQYFMRMIAETNALRSILQEELKLHAQDITER
jgi:Mannitol-1-phosphate/altronate dehydrogenases